MDGNFGAILNAIRSARTAETGLLLSQLFIYGINCSANFPLFISLATNLMSVFAIYSATSRLDVYEIDRLAKMWGDVDHGKKNDDCADLTTSTTKPENQNNKLQRLKCLTEIFTLGIFSVIRILLRNVEAQSESVTLSTSYEINEWICRALFALTFAENACLCACVLARRRTLRQKNDASVVFRLAHIQRAQLFDANRAAPGA